jgi:hypothetical protein
LSRAERADRVAGEMVNGGDATFVMNFAHELTISQAATKTGGRRNFRDVAGREDSGKRDKRLAGAIL